MKAYKDTKLKAYSRQIMFDTWKKCFNQVNKNRTFFSLSSDALVLEKELLKLAKEKEKNVKIVVAEKDKQIYKNALKKRSKMELSKNNLIIENCFDYESIFKMKSIDGAWFDWCGSIDIKKLAAFTKAVEISKQYSYIGITVMAGRETKDIQNMLNEYHKDRKIAIAIACQHAANKMKKELELVDVIYYNSTLENNKQTAPMIFYLFRVIKSKQKFTRTFKLIESVGMMLDVKDKIRYLKGYKSKIWEVCDYKIMEV